MKTSKKSLQKLTEKEARMQALLAQEKMTLEDIREKLPPEERNEFLRTLFEKYNGLKGEERDLFYQKIEPLMLPETKNQLWQYNHSQITWAISTLMQEMGRMPTAVEIAHKAELSRQTVHKHLKDYRTDERYRETVEQFRFMSQKVLAKVFQFAVQGDMRAARLYFEMAGGIGKEPAPATVHNTQTNFIQVNQVRLSQENIAELSEQQLQHLESVLKTVVKSQRP